MTDATTTPATATTANSYATVTLESDSSFLLIFDGMTVTEELGRPFDIEVDVSSAKPKSDLLPLLGGSVTVSFSTSTSTPPTYYNGFLTRIVYAGLFGGAYRYKLTLRPWIWLLSAKQDCVIFQNMSPWQIITKIVGDAEFSDKMADHRHNQAGSVVLEYCVQYRESSLDFLTRLMEKFGIYYYTQHEKGKHTLVMADDPSSHPDPTTGPIPYQQETTDARKVNDHIWELMADTSLRSGAYTYRDYNFKTPAADLTAKTILPGPHTHGNSEVYDYPGPYDIATNGEKLADVRMQDINARRQIISGTTNARSIATGARFTLSKFPDDSLNKAFQVISAVSTFSMGESKSHMSQGGSDSDAQLTDTFRCMFKAITTDLPFRLEAKTKLPMIRGPQTALVVGESGQEITTDEFGRIKVQFYWDRIGTKNQDSSCWIRVAQAWAGTGWGAMSIPRIGQEVVVEFMEGNPDRPIVTGSVYNATVTVPYKLPDNKTRSTMKSNSSLGGGGSNEFRMEDSKDSEEVFMQAQKDYNKVVLNNETVKITKDTTTTVLQGNRALTVSQGNDTHEVTQGNHKMTVGQGNHDTTVSTGNHTITISSGTGTIEAAQSITLKVGGSSIKIEPAKITLSTVELDITGSAKVSIAGAAIKVSADAEFELTGGASGKVDGGAMLTVSGGMVKIN